MSGFNIEVSCAYPWAENIHIGDGIGIVVILAGRIHDDIGFGVVQDRHNNVLGGI